MIATKSWDPIAMKLAKRGHDDYPFSINAAILVAEVLKFLASGVALVVELKLSSRPQRRRLLAFTWRSNVHMCVPALLYALANYLSFVLAALVDPGAYQTLGQLKIAMTALIFRALLRRPQTRTQWIAVGLLMSGAALASAARGKHGTSGAVHALMRTSAASFLVACLQSSMGSLANVYTELLFKAAEGNSLFFQNMQLYAYGVAVLGVTLFASEGREIARHGGLFYEWRASTWLVAASLASFGLSCAFVFRYLDNMLYVIASVICIFVSAAADGVLYGTWPDWLMMPAAGLVIFAVRLYYQKAPEPAPAFAPVPTAEPTPAAAPVPSRASDGSKPPLPRVTTELTAS